MRHKVLILILVILIILSWSFEGLSLVEETHQALNEYIAQNSINGFSLDEYLINQVGFSNGIKEELNGINANGGNVKKQVLWWLGYGGVQEDRPGSYTDYVSFKPTRSVKHYHNPSKPWDNTGLDDYTRIPSLLPPYFKDLNFTGQSSILWAQNPNQDPGGTWSWYDGRKYYYTALTGRDINGNLVAPKKENRDLYFARTFRAIGQLMHLVHDASVPEHVRNDIHILPAYEAMVEEFRTNRTKYPLLWDNLLANPIGFEKSILDIVSTHPSASVPISRIIDTDLYKGNNPDITKTETSSGQPVGVAEYTNANFFSPDTIFADGFDPEDRHYFPYPRRASAIRWKDTANNRNYLGKTGEGDAIDHLALESWFYFYRQRYFPQYSKYLPVGFDGRCYAEYASKLIPRAVGYSAGLLNYFFRGKLGVEQTGVTASGEVEITITNLSEEPLVDGTFELYYDNKDGERVKLELSATEVKGLQKETPFTTSFRRPPEFETGKEDKYILVYSGKMGLEEKAYIGKYGVIVKDFLVFYRKDGVVKVNLMDLRGIDSINASPLNPKVASEVGFSIDDSKPFSTIQRPFTHQGETIHLFGSGIQLRDGTYISSGGRSDSYNTQHFYVYDPQITQYFYLSDTYDLSYNYPPVFNVGSDRIYISKSEYWGVDMFSYANGVVMSHGNKIPSYPDYYRTFFITSDGLAYYRLPNKDVLVQGHVGVADAPLIRSLNGVKIVIKEAKVGQKYNITFTVFEWFGRPYNYFVDWPWWGEGIGNPYPLKSMNYVAVDGDTCETIAQKLAEQINSITEWIPGYIRFPAVASENEIVITENSGYIDMWGPHIGRLHLDGPMILVDYHPFSTEAENPTTIKRYDLLSDSTETYFNELLSNSFSGDTWELNNYSSKKLYSVMELRTEDPYGTWQGLPHWVLNYSGSLLARRKNEVFRSLSGGLELDFIEGEYSYNVNQHCSFDDQGTNPETADAVVDEGVGSTYQIGSIATFSKLINHHGDRHMFYVPGNTYTLDLHESWHIEKDDGYVNFINFPYSVTAAGLFYEIHHSGIEAHAIGSAHTALPSQTVTVERGSPPRFIREETEIITPYEMVTLPPGRQFSYGWCHMEDGDRGVLIQGLQLTEPSEVLPGFWTDIYFPILYSNGVRIEEVLAAKLGCASTDILGIVYYPGVNSDPGRSIWF